MLAAASFADVMFNTGSGNVTHNANGVEWYYSPNYSWGFAGAGDAVMRQSCDTNGSAWRGGVAERDRLCWHTSGGAVNGGWRAGSNIWLNGSQDWERVLMVASSGSNGVPEPAGLALFGLAAIAAARASRRRT